MKRRDFFKIMGIASGAALAACKVNKTDEKLLPYLVPPEEGIIPGVPRYARSTCMECPAHCGLNIKIREDKPVKLEGNPDHPVNKGSLCMRGQASLARLYHPNRVKQPLVKGPDGKFKPITWEEACKALQTALENANQKGLRKVFLSSRTTGTFSKLIDEFCREKNIERLKEIEIYHHGVIRQANQQLFDLPVIPYYCIDKSDVLITIGADILDTFLSPVEWAKQFAESKKKNHMKWFHMEPYLTLTGASADHRVVVNPGSEPYMLAYLLRSITPRNPIPEALMAQVPEYPLEKIVETTGIEKEMLQSVVQALEKAKNPLMISGGISTTKCNGPITIHYTGLLQWALGMIRNTVDFDHAFNNGNIGTIGDLIAIASDCRDNKVGVAIFSKLYGFTAMPAFVDVMKGAGFKVAVAEMSAPVMEVCDLVLPLSHPLESWGDTEPKKGLQSVIQPVLEPLYDTKSEGDILLTLLGREKTYRDYLAGHWQGMDENWIQLGFKSTEVESKPVQLMNEAKLAKPGAPYKKDCLFIVPSLRTYDGRSSGIALLEEIPDPLTAISYGRWISVSQADAQKKNLKTGEVVEIETIVGKIIGPVYLVPGFPAGIMTIAVDALVGTDMQVDRGTGEFMFCLEGVKLAKTGEISRLAVLAGAQETGKRSILPNLEHDEHGHEPGYKRYSLFPEHKHKDYRWGMVIDLGLCTGCSACAAACYIENNIPIVGKAEHLKGREMSWIRIEPYYNTPEQPEFVPMMCQQCDYAPCETVCPVYATYHNPEGLNAQVYNRCVGTRYCSNNCPYKVRRFNWFEHKDSLPLYHVSNPDLSVRPKGVMEKCTFCIQRIRFAKDQAKDEKRLVKDGEVVPACAQTCPTGAITFGNLMDPDSKVSQLAKSKGAYRIQELLGTEPAIYYIKGSHEVTRRDTKEEEEKTEDGRRKTEDR
jgi:Fe-S-cluster-containing dehydrogenase component/anaerobic selenocysteine-containing dehydrogenase